MIVVLGVDGLLGSWLCVKHPREIIGFTHKELDITDSIRLRDTILELSPDAVINCAGVTKRNSTSLNTMIDVNALAPHYIAKACDRVGAKLIQISTDCVFSGFVGNYTEQSISDAKDSYGQTKYRGEVIYTPHLTVRTSFIGLPDPKGRGLLAWLQNSQNSSIMGWKNYLWNGLCVTKLADVLVDLAYDRRHGVMHLYGETISKYYLLELVNELYGFNVQIIPNEEPKINRSLNSSRNDCYKITTLLMEQLKEMKAWENRYNEISNMV